MSNLKTIDPPILKVSGKVIGLTGNLGAGKSVAASVLKELGAKVLSGDEIGYAMLKPDSPVLELLIEAFGESIKDEQGGISRKVLGEIVFNDPQSLEKLNQLVHPPILNYIKNEIHSFRLIEQKIPIVVDAALIYEWGIEDWFDLIIVVAASREIRKHRYEKFRGSGSNFEQREKAQLDQSEKIRRADIVWQNNETEEQFRLKIKQSLII